MNKSGIECAIIHGIQLPDVGMAVLTATLTRCHSVFAET